MFLKTVPQMRRDTHRHTHANMQLSCMLWLFLERSKKRSISWFFFFFFCSNITPLDFFTVNWRRIETKQQMCVNLPVWNVALLIDAYPLLMVMSSFSKGHWSACLFESDTQYTLTVCFKQPQRENTNPSEQKLHVFKEKLFGIGRCKLML